MIYVLVLGSLAKAYFELGPIGGFINTVPSCQDVFQCYYRSTAQSLVAIRLEDGNHERILAFEDADMECEKFKLGDIKLFFN